MANPSLPSFVELMASLGLQDEHAANALLRGAADCGTPLPATVVNVNTPDSNPYRQSTASLESGGTPLSSASLVTPLSSPSVQRDRPTSHGRKRYSPYGLAAASGDPRDIYTRRGSVPDILSQAHYGQDRRLHHLSAPEPFHDHSSNSGRATDEDGDEQMEDASARTGASILNAHPHHYKAPSAAASSSLHCAGQPNLLISRQRVPRSAQPAVPRTKSHSHMRTTSIGARQQLHHHHHHHHQQQQQQRQQQRPPVPSPRMDMPMMDTERSNEGDIAVISISSLLRRSHPNQSRPVASSTAPNPTVSLDSPRGFQFPPVPSLPPPQPSTNASSSSINSVASGSTSTLSDSLRPPQPHRAPPSAPPTKTSFGFLPGASLGGNTSASISAVRRARHARSSSARSVREMIRERESNVLLAPLHSFHPMGETEEERDNANDSLKPTESRIRHRSTGQESAPLTLAESSGATPPSASSVPSQASHSSFLPLDDSSRSFSHRRRVKRHTAEAATARTSGKRSSPPPPLMLPTLPISLNIRALVGAEREVGDKDRLGASDAGYVSRREPHSPDPRGSWRRRVAPVEVAGV